MSLLFAPLLPWWGLGLAALLGLALAWGGRQPWRLLPLAGLLLALANPQLHRQDSQPVGDIAVAVVDDSVSMGQQDRAAQAARALEALPKLPGLDWRIEHYRPAPGLDEGTKLFQAVDRALAEVPRSRLAGVVLISDGQVAEIPPKLEIGAPIHLLLAGHKAERDRRLVVETAPGFGIVGKSVSLMVRIEDPEASAPIPLTLRRDGGPEQDFLLEPNHSESLEIPITHGGANLVELSTEALPGELSSANNRAALSISGVRDRLKVLLISGEPHAGERTWRNLLKADPGVDLVHLTILRSPGKDDRTPMKELALISFPFRELFEEKLKGFDLIILDRYSRQELIAESYYRNIVQYVRDGGALLMAVGPEFDGPRSPYNTPLEGLMPLMPSGDVIEQAFQPKITALGQRHPVTAGLPDPAHWGRWLRQIGGVPQDKGAVLLQGVGGAPLLILDQQGQGRVAELMSDSLWLWSRGWDGGGPQAELLRRLSHWLMKEPELEERQLTAEIQNDQLRILRRSLEPGPAKATVEAPDGSKSELPLADQGDGRATGQMTVAQTGLWRVTDGEKTALAALGSLNPVEMADLKATPDKLAPLIKASGGGIAWIEDGLPQFRRVSAGALSGHGWFGLRENGQSIITEQKREPLLPAPVLLLLTLAALALAWWREGR